jgi:hypothetical protein
MVVGLLRLLLFDLHYQQHGHPLLPAFADHWQRNLSQGTVRMDSNKDIGDIVVVVVACREAVLTTRLRSGLYIYLAVGPQVAAGACGHQQHPLTSLGM